MSGSFRKDYFGGNKREGEKKKNESGEEERKECKISSLSVSPLILFKKKKRLACENVYFSLFRKISPVQCSRLLRNHSLFRAGAKNKEMK